MINPITDMSSIFLRQLICTLSAWLLILGCITAQQREPKFTEIAGVNGIFLGKINSIAQDKYGGMWLSDQTNRSLTYYNGNRMTRYQHDPKKENSLGGFYPEVVVADSTGIIWIGLYGFGLDRFDPVKNEFTHYRHDPNDPNSISNDTVTAILIDHQHNIWVGTYKGLDLFDPRTGTFKNYQHDPADPSSLSWNVTRALYEDHEGTIWVGTGLPWNDNKKGGLNKLDRETGKFTRYLHDPNDKNSLINNKVRAIYEDSRGNFWIGTMGDGLHSMDRKTGKFTRHLHDPTNPEKLSRPATKTAYDHITFITEDAAGCLWIGTLANGLVRYNPFTNGLTHYSETTASHLGFRDNSGWTAYSSHDSWLWISTQESSFYKVNLYENQIADTNPFNWSVTSFFEESPGIMWYGTSNGLYRTNSAKGDTIHYQHDALNTNSLSDNYVQSIYRDKAGIFWICTAIGLNRFDTRTMKFTRYTFSPNDDRSIGWNDISMCFEDSDGRFWVGTYGGGLQLMDRAEGTFTRYQQDPEDTTSLRSNIVTSVVEDKSKDLWISLYDNGGINRMNHQTRKLKRYLPGINVNEIIRDSKGILWAGAANNIYQYDSIHDVFTLLTCNNIPVEYTEMKSMVMDLDDNIWVINEINLLMIDHHQEKIISYSKSNGYNEEFLNYGTGFRKQNGEILIGKLDGFLYFDPKTFETPNASSNIYFTGFYVNGEPYSLIAKENSTPMFFDAEEVYLEHNQNTISFSYTTIDFSHPESKFFYYKLEGHDKDWLLSPMDGQAYYFNLPPGQYTLRINSTNKQLGISVEKTLRITISPPWWRTWWAYILFALAAIGFVFFIHRFLRARVLKAERERTQAHELEQAREIEKAYHQLKTTQAQLIQSEKMASLGELTAGIAHEIQNPLNFINNFADVNAELIDELNQEIEKGDIIEAKSISQNIKDNEQKIIFHGRRADSIVKGMLQHSRSSSGLKESTDINALADEYLRLAYHGLRAKDKTFNASFKLELDPKMPMINVVAQDIGRVLLNLINNAFYVVQKKSQEGKENYKPEVIITTKSLANHIEINVQDNGNGIPEAIKEKIFQPFFTTKPTGDGTGLGLSLSYDIVKAHGGELSVETIHGEGTTFTIHLNKNA